MSQEFQTLQNRIQKASWLMMGSVLLSRLVGFLREWVLAHTVGANEMTDVYLASFTIPDFLNYLMAAGALSISFIPMLADYKVRAEEDLSKRVYRSLVSWLGSILLLLILLAMIFAKTLAKWVAPGFTPNQLEQLAFLLRIILPAQYFFYTGGLAMAVQQSHGQFLFPALGPIIYNLGIVSFGLVLHSKYGVAGFSWGVLVGAFLSQGVLQNWGARQLGFTFSPYFSLPPDVRRELKKYLSLTLPIMFGFSLVVTDEWISKYFASQLEARSVSWLSYARIEMRIPVAVIGQAAGVASFPFLSRLWSEGNWTLFQKMLLRELMKLWAVGPLAAILLYLYAEPLTQFIFGGSRFTPEDIQKTSQAVQMLSFGVFFWTAQILLARGFYATQVTWLPSLIGGLISVSVIPLYEWMAEHYAHRGLALAGSIGIGIYTTILAIMLVIRLKWAKRQFSLRPFVQFFLAWSVALVPLTGLGHWIRTWGIYHGTRLSGLAELTVATVILSLVTWVLLRRVFQKLTEGPLY